MLQLSLEEMQEIREALQGIKLADRRSQLDKRERKILEHEIKIKRQEQQLKEKSKENKKNCHGGQAGGCPATTYGWSADRFADQILEQAGTTL